MSTSIQTDCSRMEDRVFFFSRPNLSKSVWRTARCSLNMHCQKVLKVAIEKLIKNNSESESQNVLLLNSSAMVIEMQLLLYHASVNATIVDRHDCVNSSNATHRHDVNNKGKSQKRMAKILIIPQTSEKYIKKNIIEMRKSLFNKKKEKGKN